MDQEEVIEAELITAEAEECAPFNVARIFAGIDDFDLRVFALRCAGIGVAHIAERLDCSPDRVRRSIKSRKAVHDWLDAFLPETERDRADRVRQRQTDERFEKYLSLWDKTIEQAEAKLNKGDIAIVSKLLGDLSARMFGPVASKVKHEHEVAMKPLPVGSSARVNKLLDD